VKKKETGRCNGEISYMGDGRSSASTAQWTTRPSGPTVKTLLTTDRLNTLTQSALLSARTAVAVVWILPKREQ
jgi:hypothetical protein